MYPSYMVVLTTVLGFALVRRLTLDGRIGPKAVWILTCLYASKLAMLFITSKSVVWVSAVLLLAVSPPLLLYKLVLISCNIFHYELSNFWWESMNSLWVLQGQVKNGLKDETLARIYACYCCYFGCLVLSWSYFWVSTMVVWKTSSWCPTFGFLHYFDRIGMHSYSCPTLFPCAGMIYNFVIYCYFWCLRLHFMFILKLDIRL